MPLLHLQSAVPGQVGVEVLAGAAEGLARQVLFVAQPGGMLRRQARQELLVKGVAVAGDAGQQRGQAHRGIVSPRSAAGDADRHQDRTRQHGRGLGQPLRARSAPARRLGGIDPVEQAVESDLADHVAPIATAVVQVMRVPFAEDVIGPAVDRMAVVVGADVNGQLVQEVEVELCLGQQAGVGAAEDFEGLADDLLIRSTADAGTAQEQWHGAMAFVFVGFALRPSFQQGHGAVADVIVEPGQDGSLGGRRAQVALPGTMGQDRLEDPDQEERQIQLFVGEMGQQIGVMAPVGVQQTGESRQNLLGLGDVAESGAGAAQPVQPLGQPGVQALPGTGLALPEQPGAGLVEVLLPARIRAAIGEVQIAQQGRDRDLLIQRGFTHVHEQAPLIR